MFQTVLVPLDGSELSAKVVGFLEPLLQLEATSLVTLHVKGGPTGRPVPGPPGAKALEREGDPAVEILAAARDEQVSLIAMSTHGRSGVARLVRGSVAERVLRGAQVPVLLVNPFTQPSNDGGALRRILVPVDASNLSTSVLPEVTELAKVYDAHVILFHVCAPSASDSPLAERREAERKAELREQMEPHLARLDAEGVAASFRVVFEFGAAEQILAAAEASDVDLVALTTHGASGLSRWLFGSVAEHVVRECRAPLLIKRITAE